MRKILTLLLLANIWLYCQEIHPGKIYHGDKFDYVVIVFERDKWFGWDKVEHFGAGFILQCAFELTGMKKEWALATTIGLAVFYEWFDMERGVGFSYKDLTYSVSGAIASYYLNKSIKKLINKLK